MEDEFSTIKGSLKIQDELINQLKTEIESLKYDCLKVKKFPKEQFRLLSKYNAITNAGHVICLLSYHGYKFGVLTGKLAEYFKNKLEARFKVIFEKPKIELEIKGNLIKTNCGIILLHVSETDSPKVLQEYSLNIDEKLYRQTIISGTKVVAYVPKSEIVTGFIISGKTQQSGEIKCQLIGNEAYIGSVIIDESLLPIGICTGMNESSAGCTKATRIELTSNQPLTIKIITPTNLRILGMDKIIEQIDPIVKINVNEESKMADEVEIGNKINNL